MKISEVFPSKYLTAADLNGRPYTLTIKTVTLEEMITHDNKKVQKPVAWFEKAQKGFVMNSTNAHIIAGLYGDDTDGWLGQRITIYATKVKAFGSMQDAIRVKEEIPAMPKPVAQAAQVAEQSDLDDDDDVADYSEADSLNLVIDPDTGEIMDGDVLFTPASSGKAKTPDDIKPAQLLRLTKQMAQLYGAEWGGREAKMAQDASTGSVRQFSELKITEAQVLIGKLDALIEQRQPARNGAVAA
jgi:hypothetical protein